MMPTRDDDDFDADNNNLSSGFNSSDGFNNNFSSGRMQNTAGMSKAELRKSNKPIMEKRRRARINSSLNKMKSLMLEAMKKDPARHTKLEKADILEMTVKYLQSIQRQQLSMAIQTDPTVIHKFKAGFSECADEVIRYLGTLDGIDSGVRSRLANHLNNCSTGLDQIGTFSNFSAGYRSTSSSAFTTAQQLASSSPMLPSTATATTFPPLPQDVNNNGRPIQMGGVQLIPSRLPSGELALIMPNSTNLPFFPPSATIPATQSLDFAAAIPRFSAFSKPGCGFGLIPRGAAGTTHTMTTTAGSPPLSPISSISSCGDDSMHTSSDFQMKTPPPLSRSLSSSFETPPNAGGGEQRKFGLLTTGHLQQQHVSSTSELKKETVAVVVGAKRNRSDEDNCLEDEHEKKLMKIEKNEETMTKDRSNQNAMEGNSDMWRPW